VRKTTLIALCLAGLVLAGCGPPRTSSTEPEPTTSADTTPSQSQSLTQTSATGPEPLVIVAAEPKPPVIVAPTPSFAPTTTSAIAPGVDIAARTVDGPVRVGVEPETGRGDYWIPHNITFNKTYPLMHGDVAGIIVGGYRGLFPWGWHECSWRTHGFHEHQNQTAWRAWCDYATHQHLLADPDLPDGVAGTPAHFTYQATAYQNRADNGAVFWVVPDRPAGCFTLLLDGQTEGRICARSYENDGRLDLQATLCQPSLPHLRLWCDYTRTVTVPVGLWVAHAVG